MVRGSLSPSTAALVTTHQHVRCRVCGKIGDVIPPVPTPSVEGVSVEGFTITEARVEYEVICEECARKAS